jgi:hypothetical protein
MLLLAMEYDLTIEYRPRKSMFISDHLSRSPLQDASLVDDKSLSIHSLNDDIDIKPHWLNEIRNKTMTDPTLLKLAEVVKSGWPESKTDTPLELRPYFHHRDELTVSNGLILRADRVVIPKTMRSDLIKRVHAGHQGLDSCLRRAREIIYWPQMSHEITTYVESCGTCNAFPHKKQQSEPLIMHEVPQYAWEKVGCDVFTIKQRDYLVTVDYNTSFFEIDFLPNLSTNTVVAKLKSHFARYGIPSVLITDGAPTFTSEQFKHFVTSWRISHQMSSPYHSPSNGKAESAVKIAKKLMLRSAAANEDPYLALLEIRNTPTVGIGSSPAQRLFGKQTRSLIPIHPSKLLSDSKIANESRQIKERETLKTASKYKQRAQLPVLKPDDLVRMQPLNKIEPWEECIVVKQITNRSYLVKNKVNGKFYRRNRKMLKKVKQTTHSFVDSSSRTPLHFMSSKSLNPSTTLQHSEQEQDSTNTSHKPPLGYNNTDVYVTRYGRISKAPERYQS